MSTLAYYAKGNYEHMLIMLFYRAHAFKFDIAQTLQRSWKTKVGLPLVSALCLVPGMLSQLLNPSGVSSSPTPAL